MAASSTTVGDLVPTRPARAWRRLHLIPPGRTGVWRCLGFSFAVAWLPPCLLSALAGTLRGSGDDGPFAFDLATHVRLLLVVPLLVVGENLLVRALGRSVRQFVEEELLAADDPQLRAAAADFSRRRTSGLADGVLVALALVGSAAAVHFRPHTLSGWAFAHDGLSPAGWWLMLVALPLFQYTLARALWTSMLWCLLLARLSRQPLRLSATHPDSFGGLGFLSQAQASFAYLVLAVSLVIAGADARSILYEHVPLRALETHWLAFAAFVMVCVFGPLLLFAGALKRLRRSGMHELGTLGARYARQFQRRWLDAPPGDDPPLLGTPDISSLADLASSYQVVRRIGILPVQLRELVEVALALAAPLFLLLLLEVPLATLLSKLMAAVL
jgi:hypothetical protein